MENNTRKYILIPEYRPLWAMRRCFGPTHGPLSEPCPTALDIIGDLLRQTGKEALTIFEVPNPKDRKGDPVRLTLDNYTLPYDEIVKGVKATGMKINQAKTPHEPKRPEAVESDKNTAKAIADMLNGNSTSNPAEAVAEVPASKPAEEPPAEEVQAPAADAPSAGDPAKDHEPETAAVAVEEPAQEEAPAEANETAVDGETPTAAEGEQPAADEAEDGEGDEPDGEEQPASGETRHMTKAERRAARKAAAKAAEQQNNQ